TYDRESVNLFINQFLFKKPIYSLQKFIFQSIDGLALYKTLTSNQNLQHINITLQTIDDLYLLLDGLIPNIKTIIVQLCQTRLLNYRHSLCKSSYSQLTEFTLLEHNTGLVIDDIKCILAYMKNLIKLSLSIRNTFDSTFCHGTKFESILNENLSNLCQFDYTITHQMDDNTLIKNFVQWPMSFVFYENENCKWVHIYSLPWPSSKYDKRELPIFKDGYNTSVTSNVKRSEYMDDIVITKSDEFYLLTTQFRRACQITTNLSIDTILPSHICKLILSKETRNSINSLIQPSVRHLIVERRLIDESEISNFTRQFPHVKYVELLLPLEESLFVACLKNLFSFDNEKEIRCYWPQLISFSTCATFKQLQFISHHKNLHLWFIKNTDLKYYPLPFSSNLSGPLLSIWF
ncbi:unnamed protein product, partial [Rotaria sp. Silwood2]